jgi:DNA-binding MarR family transcriptional regulator
MDFREDRFMDSSSNNADLKFNTIIELINIGTLLNKYIDVESDRANYNYQYGHILIGLITYGPMIQTELSEWMLCSTQRITLTIDRMEKEGLVKRETQRQDRRINKVYITEKGLAWMKSNIAHYEKMILQSIPPKMSTKHIKEFGIILEQMRNHLIKQEGVYAGRRLPPHLKFDQLDNIKSNTGT